MNWRFKFNSLAVLALTLAFCWFFMFAKHDPLLAPIIPFGDDPYDAVGSFCMIVSPLLAALSLFRAYRPHGTRPPAALNGVFLARTQLSVPIGIQATLVADAIAMARHPTMWIGKPAAFELLALMAGLAVLSIVVLSLVARSIPGLKPALNRNAWKKALITALVCSAILVLFPEAVIHRVILHFIAIVLGFVLVAAPQAAFATVLLPCNTAEVGKAGIAGLSRSRLWLQWSLVTLSGIAIGAILLLEEIFVDGAGKAPLMQVVLVSCMFIGAGTALFLVAFAFYRKPLGIFRKSAEA